MWYGQDVMRYKLLYEMIMFCWSYRQLAEALWLSLYCIRCKCHIIALFYRSAIAIVAKAIVGETTITTKNTLPWWYVFVTVGHVFCHACTSMVILWQNKDSHTCAVVEVFHDIAKIIITEVSTSMTINRTSQKYFHQGWSTCGIHR